MIASEAAWNAVLSEFRALGGIAENVRLGSGSRGRGIFAIDPAKPVRLFAPARTLVPVEEIALRDGRLCVRGNGSAGARLSAFFEAYEEAFGWSVCGDEAATLQEQWHRLPPDVVEVISSMGALPNPAVRFEAPSVERCLAGFIEARQVIYEGKECLMPFVDLVNHDAGARGYVVEGGVGVEGTFADEVLVCYNAGDAWAHALHYGFCQRSTFAHSMVLSVTVNGTQQLAIARDVAAREMRDGIPFPIVERTGDVFHLSHLTLGNARAVDLPRAVFRKVTGEILTPQQADDVFDTLAYFNRQKFFGVLKVLRRHRGPLVEMLQEAAIGQLEALGDCVGARPL